MLTVECVIAGGLMSLGPGHRQGDREAAKYVDRILRGDSPAVLPITPPTQFILTVRRSKLDVLGINLPNDLKARVTEWLD
jgi:putative ABC transport system substrate-binding protein